MCNPKLDITPHPEILTWCIMELVPLCDGAATQNCMKSMFCWPNFDCFHVLSVEVRQKHECVIDFIFPLEHS